MVDERIRVGYFNTNLGPPGTGVDFVGTVGYPPEFEFGHPSKRRIRPYGDLIEQTMAWMDDVAKNHGFYESHSEEELFTPDGFKWYRYNPFKEQFVPSYGEPSGLIGYPLSVTDFWQNFKTNVEFLNKSSLTYSWTDGDSFSPDVIFFDNFEHPPIGTSRLAPHALFIPNRRNGKYYTNSEEMSGIAKLSIFDYRNYVAYMERESDPSSLICFTGNLTYRHGYAQRERYYPSGYTFTAIPEADIFDTINECLTEVYSEAAAFVDSFLYANETVNRPHEYVEIASTITSHWSPTAPFPGSDIPRSAYSGFLNVAVQRTANAPYAILPISTLFIDTSGDNTTFSFRNLTGLSSSNTSFIGINYRHFLQLSEVSSVIPSLVGSGTYKNLNIKDVFGFINVTGYSMQLLYETHSSFPSTPYREMRREVEEKVYNSILNEDYIVFHERSDTGPSIIYTEDVDFEEFIHTRDLDNTLMYIASIPELDAPATVTSSDFDDPLTLQYHKVRVIGMFADYFVDQPYAVLRNRYGMDNIHAFINSNPTGVNITLHLDGSTGSGFSSFPVIYSSGKLWT